MAGTAQRRPRNVATAAHLHEAITSTDADDEVIAGGLVAEPPHRSGCSAGRRDRIVQQYLAVLEQPVWRDAVRAGAGPTSDYFAWFPGHVAARLGPGAFSGGTGDDEGQPPGPGAR